MQTSIIELIPFEIRFIIFKHFFKRYETTVLCYYNFL